MIRHARSTTRAVVTSSLLMVAVVVSACGGNSTATPSTTAISTSLASQAAVTTAPTQTAAQTQPADPATAAPASPSGQAVATTGRVEVKDKHFAITLAKGWTRLDLNAADLASAMAKAGETNPQLAEAMTAQMQAMLSSGLALFALGPDPAKATQLTILQIPGGGLSLDLMDSVYGAQVKSLAKGAITSERVQLRAGEALHYSYDIPMQGVGSPVTIEQYIIPVGSNLLVMSITSADKADAKSMAESIESVN